MNSQSIERKKFPLLEWIFERFHPMDYTVVAALLMAAVFFLHPLTLNSSNFAKFFISLFFMAMQFRLLDDITDVKINKERNPELVLSKDVNLTPFWGMYYFLFLFNSFVIWYIKPYDSAFIYFAVFCVITKIWRKVLRPHVNEQLHSLVKMLKYPMFVLFLMPEYMRTSLNHQFFFTLALVYLSFLIFDYTTLEHVKNKILANITHVFYGAFLIWGTVFLQVYTQSISQVIIGVMVTAYLAYFIDFNFKKVLPDGFIILFSMILFVFLELQSAGAIR